MSRTSRARALGITALLAAAGCQDYNFNPVGDCLLKPNLKQVTLSDITTADVLFVVDDSGSMGGEQQKLADNFAAFIANLDLTNQNRVAQQLVPIDFHVAVTTTSVFDNRPDSSNPFCRNDCPDPAGGTVAGSVCCKTLGTTPVAPFRTVQKCSGASDASCLAGACRNDCVSFHGEYVCCDPTTKIPQRTQNISCSTLGTACGDLNTHYRSNPDCTLGNAVDGAPYPQGSFVAAGANPAVIHFDKELYTCATPPCTNKGGFTAAQLKTFFSQNVLVGTCGSNEEQGLAAAKLAVQKALAVPAAQRDWLHANSKLVLVFVGDEDDCSSPQDPSKGIILTGAPGADSCVADEALPPDQQKLFAVDSFTHYFTKEVEGTPPVGAAFIVSARAGSQDVCQDETCVADVCCDTACTGNASVCTSITCGGQAPGTRFLEQAGELRSASADVVAGSICDPSFGTILDRIAEIVKPPSGLLLPSQPAAEEVTVLRIVAANSSATRKTCHGPAPAGMTTADAIAAGYDWWFTTSREQLTDAQKAPTAASKFVYINHLTQACEATAGETYSAEYIGRLPDNGCSGTGATDAEAKQAADDNCVAMLGGRPGDWTCFAGTDGAGLCTAPTGTVVGTCLCGPRGGNGVGVCPADAPLQ